MENTTPSERGVRLSLPSKGRLAGDALSLLNECGLSVDKPNPRQYAASIPALPGLTVLFQRPGDIVVSVRDGSIDFGITGLDMVAELGGDENAVLVLHDALGFGRCRLCVAVPEEWTQVRTMAALADHARSMPHPFRVATRFPHLTGRFLTRYGIPFTLVEAEGTLEVAPAIGYADFIADLVSSGQTLRDNRLFPLEDGTIMASQAALIANRAALRARADVLAVARKLLELIEAHLRAAEYVAVFANMRGASPQEIAGKLFAQTSLGGLQGPTVSQMVTRDGSRNWFAIHIVVLRAELIQAIAELRSIGGSGVVVAPAMYIFEEEPERCRAMMEAVRAASDNRGAGL
jgi:ATP phosphoribosyltransferase